MFVNFGIIVGIIGEVGVFLNVVNIAVFVKQGFKDPINITLLGLSIADIGGLASLIWMSLCYNPLVVDGLPHVDFIGVQHITAGWPHVCFTRVSCWLTAFITFERYLCIAFPLKIKSILTPRRTAIVVIAIFTVIILSVVPVYVAIHFASSVSARTNSEVIGIAYIPGGAALENASIYCSTFFQLSSFVCVIVCTVGLVYKITEKSKWRNTTSSASKTESISNRDKKVVKMVVVLSVVFIASFTPVVGNLMAMLIEYEYTVGRKFQNTFLFCSTFAFNLEALNSSSNIFVYLKMSSNYREVLFSMMRKKKTPKA
ncbi:unnamed protein product [Lymnaea stagnalis]|uniref:G-protein coupled receptors family 1 profile domain-containing protein n=1 Tax=Lymnaea stagnalis TaxID=6523 RepID=A0AAV2HHH1_LYMST